MQTDTQNQANTELDKEQIDQILKDLPETEKRNFLQKQCGLNEALAQRKIVELDPLPIHLEIYSAATDDPVIIFIPGIGTYSELYANFLLGFSQRGYNVVSLDVRGHGLSGGERGCYTVEEVIEDLRLVVDYCQQNFNQEIHLWGNSLGAVLGLAAAEEIPGVRSIICHTLCTASFPPSYIHWQGWQNLNAWKWFMPWQMLDFRQFIDVKSELAGTCFVDYIDYDERMVWEYSIGTLANVYNYRHRSIYKAQNFAMALMVGEEDDILSLSYSKNLVNEMVHPCELLCIEKAGHMLPICNIEQTIDASIEWLNRIKEQDNDDL